MLDMLEARHAGHDHTANVKYGYVVLLLGIIHASLIVYSTYSSYQSWRTSGRPRGNFMQQVPVSLFMAVWIPLLVVIAVWSVHLSDHYVTTVARLGRIAYALIPLDLFLILRPSGQSTFNYLDNLSLHKWVSRLIIVTAMLHGIGYVIYWFLKGGFSSFALAITKWENLLGSATLLLLVVLLVVSLKSFRRKFYRWFYAYHTVTGWIFVVAIGFHARPNVYLYALICFGLFLFQIWLRFSQQIKIDSLTVIDQTDSSSFSGELVVGGGSSLAGNSIKSQLVVVRIPKIYFPPWTPASHIRVSLDSNLLNSYLFPSHPFTIASTIDDATVDLVLRKTKNFQFNPNIQQSYIMAGPYPSLPEPFFTTAERVSIICGGSGISFGLPILKGINSNAEIDLFWCIRNRNDMFILKTLEFRDKITVFITKDGDYDDQQPEESEGLLTNNEADDSINVEMDDFDDFDSIKKESNENNIITKSGRPNYDEIFAPLLTGEDKANKWVIACGPESLINSTRGWSKDKGIPFMSEIYEF